MGDLVLLRVDPIGAMITSSVLAIVAIWKIWKKPRWFAVAIMSPFILVESIFLGSNMLELFSGGFVPLLIAGAGDRHVDMGERLAVAAASDPRRRAADLILELHPSQSAAPGARNSGFPDFGARHCAHCHAAQSEAQSDSARAHHACVVTASEPRAPDDRIAAVEHLSADVDRVTLTYGFMRDANVSRGLTLARARGVQFDPLKTSFFVSRRVLSPRSGGGMARWQDLLYISLARNATNASAFFHIPAARTVELGAQLSI